MTVHAESLRHAENDGEDEETARDEECLQHSQQQQQQLLQCGLWETASGRSSNHCSTSTHHTAHHTTHRYMALSSTHHTTHRYMAFPVAGPSVTSPPTLSAFRQRLKTYLFSLSFPDIIHWTDILHLTISGF